MNEDEQSRKETDQRTGASVRLKTWKGRAGSIAKLGWRQFVAIAAGLAIFAGLAKNLDEVYVFIQKFLPEKSLYIVNSNSMLNDEGLESFGFIPGYAFKGDNAYVLVVALGVKFKKEELNQPAMLRSFEGQMRAFYAGEEIKVKASYAGGEKYKVPVAGANKRFMMLEFPKKPNENSIISISVGPISKELKLDDYKWVERKYEYTAADAEESRWHLAFGKIDIVLDEPSWAILTKSRILATPNGKPDIVEATIDNRSDHDFLVNDLYIHATHPKSSGDSCMFGDDLQYASLTFETLPGESDTPKAWVDLGGQKVVAQTKFNVKGVCSGYSFTALIPLQQTIARNSTGRVLIRMSEFPQIVDAGTRSDLFGEVMGGAIAPKRLSQWMSVWLTINAKKGETPAFPLSNQVEDESLPELNK